MSVVGLTTMALRGALALATLLASGCFWDSKAALVPPEGYWQELRAIDRFKELLVRFKRGTDLSLDERVELLRSDAIGRGILEEVLPRESLEARVWR